MSDLYKGFIISIVVFLLWSAGCFFFGYIFCDTRATERTNRANQQLAEQQQRYEELIRLADERLQRVKEDLYGKISDNGQTIAELSGLVEQIKRQRIDI